MADSFNNYMGTWCVHDTCNQIMQAFVIFLVSLQIRVLQNLWEESSLNSSTCGRRAGINPDQNSKVIAHWARPSLILSTRTQL